MKRLKHSTLDSRSGCGFVREFALFPNSNRLKTMTIQSTRSYDYIYDENGNVVKEDTSRHFEWDHSGRLRAFYLQIGEEEPSVYTQYLYDPSGKRIKKIVRKHGQIEVTVYNDGAFEYHILLGKRNSAYEIEKQNNFIHIMDKEKRVAIIRIGDPFDPNDSTANILYYFGDHLESSNIVINKAGVLVDREEYSAYGETSFGSFAKKRFRFCSKERDEDTL